MMRRLVYASLLTLSAAAALIAPTACEAQKNPCDDKANVNVTGSFVRGETDVLTLQDVTAEGTIASNIFIEEVRVGGVQATSSLLNFGSWSAKLPIADITNTRDINNVAHLPVVATDICGTSHSLGEFTFNLGPDANRSVTSLDIKLDPIARDCYLPITGNSVANIIVTADATNVGESVTISATSGTFAGAASPLTRTFLLEGTTATVRQIFTPLGALPGTVYLTASAKDSPTKQQQLVLAGPPELRPSTGVIPRDVEREIAVVSRGRLDSCAASISDTSAATVKLAQPDGGAIGAAPLALNTGKNVDCLGIDQAVISIRFSPTVADGAVVTLQCFDTAGQEVHGDFSVATATQDE